MRSSSRPHVRAGPVCKIGIARVPLRAVAIPIVPNALEGIMISTGACGRGLGKLRPTAVG
eukprot:11004845-Alexandrium_andersonii.AAC.1